MFRLLLIISGLFLVSSHSGANDTITIIFNGPPPFVRNIKKIDSSITIETKDAQVTIIDKFRKYFFDLRPSKTDTIQFLPEGRYIMLKYFFSVASSYDYLIKKGDTVVFDYQNGVPVCNIQNRPGSFLEINYERFWRNRNIPSDTSFTSLELYHAPILGVHNMQDVQHLLYDLRRYTRKYYPEARDLLKRELICLDSLRLHDHISDYYFSFYRNKAIYRNALLAYEQGGIGKDMLTNLMNNSFPDSTFPYSYCYDLVERVSDSLIVNKAKAIYFSSGKDYDYRDVFDRLMAWDKIAPLYKKLLLYKAIQKIGANASAADLKKYYLKFTESIADTFFLNQIRKRFYLDHALLTQQSDSLYLIDTTKTPTTLEQLIRDNRGKVVYVDFWASWCAPCRSAMPESHALRKFYKNRDVVFIYLSIDKDLDAWNKANREEHLTENSYLVLNSDNSGFLKSINFATIPRYLIFNKKGVLLHHNAPGPPSPELKNEFERSLE